MAHTNKLGMFILFLLALVDLSINAVIKEIKGTNRTTYEQGLYSPEDDVQILTVNNFDTAIYGSEKAWMVEFYSNWCGYCQRSAPIYKAFATDVKDWSDIVGIGALDCAIEENAPVCTYFGVTKYPTFKYFHEHYVKGPENVGLKIVADSHTNVSEHRKNLVDIMVKEQFEGRGKIFPNLKPFNYTDETRIFETDSQNPKYAFLVIQEANDDIGPSITLDFHKVKEAVVRYSFVNDTKIRKDLFPALYSVAKGYAPLFLSIPSADRLGFRMKITQYLSLENITVTEFHMHPHETPSFSDPQVTNTTQSELNLVEKIKKMGDVVFQVDLETALRYSLRQEVGLTKEITGEKLEALKKYINLLAKYFPFGENGKKLLSEIERYVSSGGKVEGIKIKQMMKDAEKPGKHVFSSPKQWLGCMGSVPSKRGYPCGLWRLFHYLTVNVADYEQNENDTNPNAVLQVIHGYVKNFFSCEDCSNHFVEMAERRGLNNVTSFDGSIIWLWKAHNEVNKRLSGDETEDPEYPKVRFPTKANCPGVL
ncbi:hypothetical protein JTB14_032117 [Gonioctena quinquepunctata]|nr:hypothetical protein JTB14_032117 [Gonioctena quinquepunctata]